MSAFSCFRMRGFQFFRLYAYFVLCCLVFGVPSFIHAESLHEFDLLTCCYSRWVFKVRVIKRTLFAAVLLNQLYKTYTPCIHYHLRDKISPSLSIGARARLMKIGYYTFAELCSYNNRFLSYIQNFSPFLMGSNPPTDSSKPASVDQFWKIFADIKETDVNCTDMNRKGVSKGGGGSAVLTVLGEIVELTWSEDEEKRRVAGTHLQLFRERLSEKVHSTIPKGIVGGFECSALQINLKKWHGRPRTYVCEC